MTEVIGIDDMPGNAPVNYTTLAVMILIMVLCLIFFIYCWYIERKQRGKA